MASKIPPLAQDLIKKKKLGWANVPNSGHSVLVEPGTGCMIRDQSNQPYKGPRVNHLQTGRFDRQEFYDHAKSDDIEGRIPWLYQDKKHFVTIGIGHKIDNVEFAVEMAGYFENTAAPGQKVTGQDILDAWEIVTSAEHTGNNLATYYEHLTTLRLKSTKIFDLFDEDLNEILRELMAHDEYSEVKFDSYPTDAKFAIADLAFNLGATGLADGYKLFTGAVLNRNWALAAGQSNRPEVQDIRNTKIRDLLESAARKEPFFLDPTCRKPRSPLQP